MNNIIEIKDLTKSYGKNRGVESVTLNIEEGEIFGFIGPNGAGKSTLIRTLLGLQKPTSGTATIFGHDISEFSKLIASDVGYLPSEVFYYDGMKVKDLLKYSASFYNQDCSGRITELATRLDLDLNRKIQDLSYGNRKKVGIVQALLHSPKLLILDEPTGGLDPLMQQTFFEILKEENDRGVTIFLSSHILSEVQRMCERVAIIKEGNIIQVNNVKETSDDNYKKCHIEVANGEQLTISELAGVTNFKNEEGKVSFIYKGDINEIIKHLSTYNLKDLSIEEPSLEEIFIHFYQ
ncbi:ABC transporter ATP-binding protein [Mollicutes bacterium LVI A0039]|nr:ABC transporter ATP-binding protein [Mollicutes bacterium LVI A0039]